MKQACVTFGSDERSSTFIRRPICRIRFRLINFASSHNTVRQPEFRSSKPKSPLSVALFPGVAPRDGVGGDVSEVVLLAPLVPAEPAGSAAGCPRLRARRSVNG